MNAMLSPFVRDDSGVKTIVHGLIAGLVAVVMVTATKTIGGKLANSFVNIGNKL